MLRVLKDAEKIPDFSVLVCKRLKVAWEVIQASDKQFKENMFIFIFIV